MIQSTIISWCIPLILAGPACALDADDLFEYGQPQPWAEYPDRARLEIIAPAPGSTHMREVVDQDGELVALVPLEVRAFGPIERVVFELPKIGVLGDADDDGVLLIELTDEGQVTVLARAYDHQGRVIATAAVDFEVRMPTLSSCHDWLDAYGVQYKLGPRRDGVAQPVTLTTPINGVLYRYHYGSGRRATFFMDCSLAVSLVRAAPELRRRDIVEVSDMGVYNYRCIGGEGTPPNCPRGMSQHAHARGIDIAGFTARNGTFYSVKTDWVIDPPSQATCQAATETPKDRFLHEVICTLKHNRVWNIVLTPNYNAAHRDHFHVDLTPGRDFIKSLLVDVGPDHH